MIREYELTEEEFITVLEALSHAEEQAVHSHGAASFRQARVELHSQYDDQEPKKITEVDNE